MFVAHTAHIHPAQQEGPTAVQLQGINEPVKHKLHNGVKLLAKARSMTKLGEYNTPFKPSPGNYYLMTHLIDSLLVKVHSRCNLMCDYCYEYNSGNTSWRSKPKEMSKDVYEQMLVRVKEHCDCHQVKEMFFSFHGGEPLLRQPDWYRYAITKARTVLEPNTSVSFGMQSNGTLLTMEWVELLHELNIGYGISIDGPKETHDKYRVHSNGDPSFDLTMDGLRLLLTPKGRSIWGGVLSVIDVDSDPVEVFEFLAQFNPPSIDFLEPHGSWGDLPSGKTSYQDLTYGQWLIRLFNFWFDHPDYSKIPIRKFDEIIEHCYGGRGSLESLGLEPVTLVTVATDGMVESVDCIKAAHPNAHYLGMNIYENTFDDIVDHPMIKLRQIGMDALDQVCKNCEHVLICGGGYFAHRYDPSDDSFSHRTIYCEDLKLLIGHIRRRLGR